VHYGALQDSFDKAGKRYKCPPCCEQLYNILGHDPYDRGELVDAGGVGSEEEDSERTPETPPPPTQCQANVQARPPKGL
jgi:hypothetical protein